MPNFLELLAQRARRAEIYSTREYWNQKATDLEGSSASMWRNKVLNALYHEEQTVRLDALFDHIEGDNALDLGCGTGRMSRYLARKGAHVTAIDFAEDALEIARVTEPSADIDYRCLSVLEIDDTEKFDVVLSWGVLTIGCTQIDELDEAMGRIYTAMKPGARLVLMEPVHNSFLHRVLKLSEKDFVGSIEASGLVMDGVEHFHFWPARLALAYLDFPGWVTRPAYGVGQRVLRAFNRKRWGDYQLYIAHKPGSV